MCEVCGRIVNRGALSKCGNPDCGLRFCLNCDCPCPIEFESDAEAAEFASLESVQL